MLKNRRGFTAVELIVIIMLWVAIGWCANLYRLASCDFASPYKAEVIHGVGVFVVPLSAITGFIDLGE